MRENRSIETPEIAPQDVQAPEVTDSGNLDKALTSEPKLSPQSELEKWEIQNGKYGLEYLGIKEIAKEFPLKAQFGQLDKYIKEQMEERGYDKTPTAWQDILKEIEDEIGSSKLNAYERLKKISGFLQTLHKYNKLKALKESYSIRQVSS